MPKFEVSISLIEKYRFDEIEAETEEEAIEKANEMLADDVNKGLYHDDSDAEELAHRID